MKRELKGNQKKSFEKVNNIQWNVVTHSSKILIANKIKKAPKGSKNTLVLIESYEFDG